MAQTKTKILREGKRAVEQINGREGETATFIQRSLVSLTLRGGGFAPRHLNRSTLLDRILNEKAFCNTNDFVLLALKRATKNHPSGRRAR